nr:hypothetical protein REQ54_02525 [Rhizobium sp. Q54]
MTKILHESGVIQSWESGRVHPQNMQYVPQMVLVREDGTRVEINDFVIDDVVFGRFHKGKLCTIAFIHKKVVMNGDLSQVYSNQIVGYADEDGWAVPKFFSNRSLGFVKVLWWILGSWLAVAIVALLLSLAARETDKNFLVVVGSFSLLLMIPLTWKLWRLTDNVKTSRQIRDLLRGLGYVATRHISY